MKVLVTGAAGFIGSNLTKFLLDNNYKVVGIDNFNNYYSPKVKKFNISAFENNENFTLYDGDITSQEDLTKTFSENVDALVHLAAWAGVTYSVKKPLIYEKNNSYGTTLLTEFAIKNNVKNFIFASTSSIYGDNPTPFKENMDTSKPNAPYPATKKASEVMLYTYSKNKNLNVSILRFFNPLGPYLRPDMALPKLIRSAEYGNEFQLYQDPSSSARDYTYILDMCSAIKYLIENPLKYEIINLGNSNPVSLSDLIEEVEEVTGKSVKTYEDYLPGQMKETFADISKAKKMINYNPSTSLSEMVKIYYDWFMAQPEWYKKGDY